MPPSPRTAAIDDMDPDRRDRLAGLRQPPAAAATSFELGVERQGAWPGTPIKTRRPCRCLDPLQGRTPARPAPPPPVLDRLGEPWLTIRRPWAGRFRFEKDDLQGGRDVQVEFGGFQDLGLDGQRLGEVQAKRRDSGAMRSGQPKRRARATSDHSASRTSFQGGGFEAQAQSGSGLSTIRSFSIAPCVVGQMAHLGAGGRAAPSRPDSLTCGFRSRL